MRCALGRFTATGSRFALVVLRVLRFEETTSYYGEEASDACWRLSAGAGCAPLGPDAQHFVLPDGRVAFLFEIERRALALARALARLDWTDPTTSKAWP